MSPITYEETVVVITDGSTPSAQLYARLFKARGAKVVLNIPPSSKSHFSNNLQQGSDLATLTLGLDFDRVLAIHEEPWDGDKIVAAAIEKYGSVHILIQTASFHDPKPSDGFWSSSAWASSYKATLKGAFKCTKAVWPYFRKNRWGRIIFESPESMVSEVAEYAGRFGLLGFAQTLAREGSKYNILVNVVSTQAPHYVTGHSMSKTTKTQPRISASLIGHLAHDSNRDKSGSLFEIKDNGVSRLRWERGEGILLNPDANFSARALISQWHGLDDFSRKDFSTAAMDFERLLPLTQALPANQKSEDPRFDGRVVVVTGGGSGLGRCYAIAFARLGASVVVNDWADPGAVVNEIRKAGGQATAVIDSVENGQQIVDKAIAIYGRIDVLVNNAGFVRDKSFTNMDENLWDTILNVHLNGTYQMTKAVWPHFLRQGQGSIVNTTSTSGIYGNFGQSNYSAAKLGILGISEATAREGMKHNIRVNTIAPVASTGGLAQALSDTNNKTNQSVFKPEYIAPIVLLLSSDMLNGRRNEITGGLFECGCGWHARTRLRPSSELNFTSATEISPELLSNAWVESAQQPPKTLPASEPAVDVLKNIERFKQADTWRTEYKFTGRDVILYNLAVGAKRNDLALVYEESESFQPVPTFGVIPFFSLDVIYHHGRFLPKFKADQSLLGEVYLEIFQRKLPTSGHLTSTRSLVDVLDKGNAAVGLTGYTTADSATGEKLFYNEVSFFMRGAGGFGGARERANPSPSSRQHRIPSRQPDAIDEFHTSEEQAALYRLTGDTMAMHIDPNFSRKGGFPVPILHGVCFMGIAGKHLFQRYGAYRSIKARIAGVVVPGQKLRTESWRDDNEKGIVVFQMRVVDTGKLCIAGGWIRLWDPSAPQPKDSRL